MITALLDCASSLVLYQALSYQSTLTATRFGIRSPCGR